jgi:hypothetical protein
MGLDPLGKSELMKEEEKTHLVEVPRLDERGPIPDDKYRGAGFYYMIVGRVDDLIAEALELYFRDHPLAQEFKWKMPQDLGGGKIIPNPESKVFIGMDFSEEERYFPQVIPVTFPAEGMETGLGADQGHFSYPDKDGLVRQYIRKGGLFNIDCSISCSALNQEECERILDVVGLGMVYPLHRALATRTIVIHPNTIKIGNIEERPYTGGSAGRKAFFQGVVSFRVQAPWVHDFELIGPTIEGLDVSTTKQSQPNIDP